MTKTFVPFRKISAHERKLFHRIKKWSENLSISPKIDIGGTYYQILRTSRLFNQNKLRKIVVCTEDGQFVNDRGLTEDVLKIYTYFHYLNVLQKDIVSDSKRDGKKQFNLLIAALKDINEHLAHEIDEEENDALNDLMVYYEKTKELINHIGKAAQKCLQLKEKLQQRDNQTIIGNLEIEQLKNTIDERENNRGQLEALMLENSLYLRKRVKSILTKESNKALIKNKENIERIIKDLDYLEYLTQHFIAVGQADWAFDEKWLGIKKGKFTVEKYIEELNGKNLGEIFVKTNVAMLLKDHWMFA